MHKIDSKGSTADNKFTEGDRVKSISATRISASWLNTIQEEIVNAVQLGGQQLDKNNNQQLLDVLTAIDNKINNLTVEVRRPRGEVGRLQLRLCNVSELPELAENEIFANGSLVNRADYPDLFKYALNSKKIISEKDWNDSSKPDNKIFFSTGDGSTTFRLGLISAQDLVK